MAKHTTSYKKYSKKKHLKTESSLKYVEAKRSEQKTKTEGRIAPHKLNEEQQKELTEKLENATELLEEKYLEIAQSSHADYNTAEGLSCSLDMPLNKTPNICSTAQPQRIVAYLRPHVVSYLMNMPKYRVQNFYNEGRVPQTNVIRSSQALYVGISKELGPVRFIERRVEKKSGYSISLYVIVKHDNYYPIQLSRLDVPYDEEYRHINNLTADKKICFEKIEDTTKSAMIKRGAHIHDYDPLFTLLWPNNIYHTDVEEVDITIDSEKGAINKIFESRYRIRNYKNNRINFSERCETIRDALKVLSEEAPYRIEVFDEEQYAKLLLQNTELVTPGKYPRKFLDTPRSYTPIPTTAGYTYQELCESLNN